LTRIFDALWRCAADPGPTHTAGPLMGPGSAARHFAPHRARDARRPRFRAYPI